MPEYDNDNIYKSVLLFLCRYRFLYSYFITLFSPPILSLFTSLQTLFLLIFLFLSTVLHSLSQIYYNLSSFHCLPLPLILSSPPPPFLYFSLFFPFSLLHINFSNLIDTSNLSSCCNSLTSFYSTCHSVLHYCELFPTHYSKSYNKSCNKP